MKKGNNMKIYKELLMPVYIGGVEVDNVYTVLEIELSSEDIKIILEESKDLHMLKDNLNNIATFLNGIPEKLIKEMSIEAKNLVINFLEHKIKQFKEC